MNAVDLLSEYARRHDEGVAGRGWRPLAELFAEDAAFVFHGAPFPCATGRTAILRAFETGGPDDGLVLGEVRRDGRRRASAIYGWRTAPDLVAGTLRLTERDGRIATLDVWVRKGAPAAARRRRGVRVLIVDPAPAVLLLRCREPVSGAEWWLTPGGGIDEGEDERAAARRELAEEVGLDADVVGPAVWHREDRFVWNHVVVRQTERFLLHRVPARFVASPRLAAGEIAEEGLGAHRWWSLPDLLAADDEVFSPRRLPELLDRLLRDGPPASPVDAGL